MNVTDAEDPVVSTTVCRDCGSSLNVEDPLGGGLCEACLWHGLSAMPSASVSPMRDLVPGHEILEELGRGGMGVVYRARQIAPQREVAIKMLRPLDSGEPELRARFQQEARTLAELDHPAILPLYQVGEVDDLPYFTMKLASGGTLAHRLADGGAWSPRRAAELVAGLADALQYAHAHGVIHRDLKPGNVLFDDAGRAYLADFGLAKLEGERSGFSRSAGVLGTPAYLAPEIAASGARSATTLSDVYSLGAVLFELLTGRPPFSGDGVAALLVKIAEEEPPTPTSINGRVPRDLEIVCLKCLRKAPADRYAGAADLADDLRRWLRGEPVRAKQFTPVERLVKWAGRRPALAALSGALGVTLIGSAVWLAQTNRELVGALGQAESARQRANQRAEFFLGEIADQLDAIGRLDILNGAYEDVLKTDVDTDEPSRRRQVRLLTGYGRNLVLQNRHDQALVWLHKAVDMAAALPDAAENGKLYTDAAAALAEATAETSTFEKAVGILSAAEARLAASSALTPVGRERALASLAEAYAQIGLATVRSGRDVQAKAAEAVQHRREVARHDNSAASRLDLARSLRLHGDTLTREAEEKVEKGKIGEARPLFEAAKPLFEEGLALARAQLATGSDSVAWRREEAHALGCVAQVITGLQPERTGEVITLLGQERDYFRQAAQEDPLNWRSNRELSAALHRLALAYRLQGNQAMEDATRGEQETVVNALWKQRPKARSWLLAGMNDSLALGQWHLERGRPEVAEDHFDVAQNAGESLLDMRPATRPDQRGFVEMVKTIGGRWKGAGHPDREKATYARALAYAEKQVATGPAKDAYRWIAAGFERRLADWSRARGEFEASLAMNLAALKRRAEALKAWTVPAQVEPNAVPNSFLQAERDSFDLGRVAEGVALAEESVKLRQEVGHRGLDPRPWAEAVIVAAEKGVSEGGATGPRARRLAAMALGVLFGESEGGGQPQLAPYVPPAPEASAFAAGVAKQKAKLKALAGPESGQVP